jgi:hypothetical protein
VEIYVIFFKKGGWGLGHIGAKSGKSRYKSGEKWEKTGTEQKGASHFGRKERGW